MTTDHLASNSQLFIKEDNYKHLKCVPKQQHFCYACVVRRSELAAIDHNYHVIRKEAAT